MEPNLAGVDVPACVGSWPIFHDDASCTRVDPFSTDMVDGTLIVPDWLFDAFADHVEEIELDNNDAEPLSLRPTAGADPVACTRCYLKTPVVAWELVGMLSEFFNASSWYDLIASDGGKPGKVNTPRSCFVRVPAGATADNDAVTESLREGIAALGGRAFVRLNHASSKTPGSVASAEEAVANLMSTERTAAALRVVGDERQIMLREWVADMPEHMEMRCFVHGGVARGVCLHLAGAALGGSEEEKGGAEGKGEESDGGDDGGDDGWGVAPDGPPRLAQPSHNFGIVPPFSMFGGGSGEGGGRGSDDRREDRGVSRQTAVDLRLRLLREALRTFLSDVVAATEYHDFVADVAIHRSEFGQLIEAWAKEGGREGREGRERAGGQEGDRKGRAEGTQDGKESAQEKKDHLAEEREVVNTIRQKLWLVEINTPVWLLATSGLWCLDLESHRDILMGPLSPFGLLTYPCMMASVEGHQEVFELFS